MTKTERKRLAKVYRDAAECLIAKVPSRLPPTEYFKFKDIFPNKYRDAESCVLQLLLFAAMVEAGDA